ncbi:hypothetical protein ES332_D11G110800v1 [Gossypium tomentosum]|uniref:Uncharacterized protein n=1 Tax=Gossypium tomentosum TaxID=34277 RepID=A0A5D2IKT1_GOSTO|nr:hypothetical protein ES332_D11G110800v1 [Gossypium tomentosum]
MPRERTIRPAFRADFSDGEASDDTAEGRPGGVRETSDAWRGGGVRRWACEEAMRRPKGGG